MFRNTEDLLKSLGWPETDLNMKGVLMWQAPHEDKKALPVTASLTVFPQKVVAKVLNMLPSDTMQQHFLVEWDISQDTPIVTKCVVAGSDTDIGVTTHESLAKQFTSLVALIDTCAKIDILGTRVKNNSTLDV